MTTLYDQFWDARVRAQEMDAAMRQPLDVAVFSAQTARLWAPRESLSGTIQRHGYIRRWHSADDALPALLCEASAMARGS